LENIIIKALDKNQDRRYQSAREMRVDLVRLSASASVAVVERKPVHNIRWLWAAGTFIAILVLLTALNVGGLRDRLLGVPTTGPIESLAVLPLENLSDDPEHEYFADGMTDELIGQLAQISALKVISRTSVMQYKEVRKPLPKIAEELNVDAVVEGTVRRSDNRVRITAQLIEAATDRHLWARSYERDARDVLALQSEVAKAIARELQLTLTIEEEQRLAGGRPVNVEAHDAYIRGRYFLEKAYEVHADTRLERVRAAIVSFQHAIELDPNYGKGYVGLADAHSLLGAWEYSPVSEVFPLARQAALKALEIDDTIGEAHIALGYIKEVYDWDFAGAAAAYQRAIELIPNDRRVYSYYANLLSKSGRHEEAIEARMRSIELDPLRLGNQESLGRNYLHARQYEQAIEQYKKVVELAPAYYYLLGNAYEANGDYKAATTAYNHLGEEPNLEHAHVYAMTGKEAEARAMLAKFIQRRKESHVEPSRIATTYAALGDKDEAFAWLDIAYEEHDSFLSAIKVWPRFDPLRDDPRFQDLLRRMNLPE
jgi:TolB-like protein/Flp pilus assembly protein TadD